MPGQILGIDEVKDYTAAQASALAKVDYGSWTIPAQSGVTKITFHYQSKDLDGTPITVYARAYIPDGKSNLPIFGFAPGTTGIGDTCAASLEQYPAHSLGNYDGHMMMYAGQGYASVITDYEGMRDPARIHHYMVGPLEGRAVLDSIRAMENLRQTKGKLDEQSVFLGGYSQGGHAAFWADEIAASYAPEMKITGVVGWGPVIDVRETLADVTKGADINWFGPYVLDSYQDYYKQSFDLPSILQPQWIPQLSEQVQSHCIDTDITFWGTDPAKVYQPGFLASITSPDFATQYPQLAADMAQNRTGDAPTPSAKRINEGRQDIIVPLMQQQAIIPTMCATSRGPVQLVQYNATHYNDMAVSVHDTLTWMQSLRKGDKPATTCS